jgi:hypothetical protein
MAPLIKGVPAWAEGHKTAQHHLPAENGHLAQDQPHRGEQYDQDGLRADDGGRVAAVSRVSPGDIHFGLQRGGGAGIWALMGKEACELANGLREPPRRISRGTVLEKSAS